MHVAIIGATGMLGQPVAHALIQAGFTVRIIARDVEKACQKFPENDVVYGNMEDVDSLLCALTGMDLVYLNLSVKQNEKKTDFHTEAEGIVNLIEAARQTGVRRIGYLSSIIMRYQGTNGFHWWVFDIKQRAVQLIKASGIAYSIFYPSCFMESLNGTQRLGRFILLVGRSDVKPWYISAHDYGKQVAQAFHLATAGQNQEYVVQGPQAITQHEAAERFVTEYKKEKLVVLTTSPFLMKLGRPFSLKTNYGRHITEAINKYPEVFEADRTWAELSKPEITVETFASEL